MLTTALQWMIGKIPVNLIPLQFRPAAVVLKRLIPYLGSDTFFLRDIRLNDVCRVQDTLAASWRGHGVASSLSTKV
jgi:hypothetical protein